MLFRLTYMELDILCVVRLWIFSRGSLLKHKMCCVYSGAHLLAVNFINSHMRLNGRQLSRKTLDKLIYSIPLSSLWLCYLFSFTLELIIRRWIQFNSNTFSCSSSFVVCRVSWCLGFHPVCGRGIILLCLKFCFFFFFFLGRRLPIVSAMDAWSPRPRFFILFFFFKEKMIWWVWLLLTILLAQEVKIRQVIPSWFPQLRLYPSLFLFSFLYGSCPFTFT